MLNNVVASVFTERCWRILQARKPSHVLGIFTHTRLMSKLGFKILYRETIPGARQLRLLSVRKSLPISLTQGISNSGINIIRMVRVCLRV